MRLILCYRSVRKFWTALVSKMVKTLPYKSQLLKDVEVLRPQQRDKYTSQSGGFIMVMAM